VDEKIMRIAWEIILSKNQILGALKVTPSEVVNGELVPSTKDIEASRQRAVEIVAKIIEQGLKWEPPKQWEK
jgi:hypothetical protein